VAETFRFGTASVVYYRTGVRPVDVPAARNRSVYHPEIFQRVRVYEQNEKAVEDDLNSSIRAVSRYTSY